MPRKKLPQLFLFGGFSHEGVTSLARTLGFDLREVALRGTRPANWTKHANLVAEAASEGLLAGSVLYLHTTLLLEASRDEYMTSFLEILGSVQRGKALVFIYEDNLRGIFAPRDKLTGRPQTVEDLEAALLQAKEAADDRRSTLIQAALWRVNEYADRPSLIEALVEEITISGVQIAPFASRGDVTLRIQEFFQDLSQGVFLRLYVPNDRLQAAQLRSLLEVLERYLVQVEGKQFSIDTIKTDQGVTYSFRSKEPGESLETVNSAFRRFDDFMQACGDNPDYAVSLLQQRGLDPQQSQFAVEKFARDYRRLVVDIRHEFERKSLQLKQRLEIELSEHSADPQVTFHGVGPSGLLSAAATASSVSVNIGSLSVVNANTVSNIVDSVINGSVSYSANDKLLLQLFDRYAEELEKLQCRSDLDQIKDPTSAEPARKTAWQRLSGFLGKVAKRTGDVAEKVAVDALSKYLEALLKGTAQ